MVGHACLISRPQCLLGINQLEIGIFGATSFVFYARAPKLPWLYYQCYAHLLAMVAMRLTSIEPPLLVLVVEGPSHMVSLKLGPSSAPLSSAFPVPNAAAERYLVFPSRS